MRSRVDYVILYVRDLGPSLDFYRKIVQLSEKFRQETYAEFVTEGCKFGLLERGALPELLGRDEPQSGFAGEVCFLVDDVDAEAERLRTAGAEILAGPSDRPWGHRTLHFLDPDGHVVEFAQEIPRAESR